ncbi:hypothetical protein PDJAM_G00207010, partial [Pangasius djambal]|nr:hypothetical protein [Pangasius djambal]
MSSAEDRQQAQAPDAAPSQLCDDVKTETSGGGTSDSEVSPVDQQNGGVHMELRPRCVKKEETLELSIYTHRDDLNNTPDVISIKEEEADKGYLYCEVCKSFFFNKCEVHGPPLFIPDTAV